ncbi:MAG: glycosyltransferase family 4 protein [Nitrospirae bacterium]|nr:glycosyltransferase family 4 protein [Nitrospirota bacterium]
MRIAVFHNIPTGGAKRALQGFVRALSSAGHAPDVFVPETAQEGDFLPLKPWAKSVTAFPVGGGFRSWAMAPGLRRTNPLLWASRTMRRLPPLFQVHTRIAAEIDRGAYDLVYSEHDEVTIAPYLLRRLRTPSVFYCQQPYRASRESIIEQLEFGSSGGDGFGRAIRRRFWRRVTRTIAEIDRENAQHAGLLLANSYFSRESILRAYGRDSRVCRIGIETAVFHPTKVPRENVVLSVGALMAPKGYEFIIRSLARIPPKRRPGLVAIGDREDPRHRSHLETLASKFGVHLEIRLGVEDSALAEAYHRAKLLVYAPYLEPFGLAPLEAMACGTPVVAVGEGGVRETVVNGETGRLVARDETEFGEAVENLLEDDKTRRRMGRAGHDRIRADWSWETCGPRFTNTISDWLRQKKDRGRES